MNAEICFIGKDLLLTFSLRVFTHTDQLYLDLTLARLFYCLYQFSNIKIPSSLNSYHNKFEDKFK